MFAMAYSNITLYSCLLPIALLCASCEQKVADYRINQMDSTQAAELAKKIESTVTPKLAEGLTLKLWGVDSLVADPVSLDIDDQGRVY